MRLIFEATGKEVELGSLCKIGELDYEVDYFRPPHKSSSEGKVSVRLIDRLSGYKGGASEYYVSVIGARWIEREDRGEARHD